MQSEPVSLRHSLNPQVVLLTPPSPLLSPRQCAALVRHIDDLFLSHLATHPDKLLHFEGGITFAPKVWPGVWG